MVRSTLPNAQGGPGRGISIEDDPTTKARANVTIHACVIEQNTDHGVSVAGSDATFEATVVRSTVPGVQGVFGRGIGIQDDPVTKARASVTVSACLIEQNQELGVFVAGSDATIEATVVRSTPCPTPRGRSGAASPSRMTRARRHART